MSLLEKTKQKIEALKLEDLAIANDPKTAKDLRIEKFIQIQVYDKVLAVFPSHQSPTKSQTRAGAGVMVKWHDGEKERFGRVYNGEAGIDGKLPVYEHKEGAISVQLGKVLVDRASLIQTGYFRGDD